MHAAVKQSADGLRIPNGRNHPVGVDEIVRLGHAAVWSSDEMRKFLKQQNIEVINYTQLQKIQAARNGA